MSSRTTGCPREDMPKQIYKSARKGVRGLVKHAPRLRRCDHRDAGNAKLVVSMPAIIGARDAVLETGNWVEVSRTYYVVSTKPWQNERAITRRVNSDSTTSSCIITNSHPDSPRTYQERSLTAMEATPRIGRESEALETTSTTSEPLTTHMMMSTYYRSTSTARNYRRIGVVKAVLQDATMPAATSNNPYQSTCRTQLDIPPLTNDTTHIGTFLLRATDSATLTLP